jgi:hypothetical protein
MSDCDKNTPCCPTNTDKGEGKAQAPAQTCCPVETIADRWSESFCQAMKETQVEILKAKIKKAWGADMEKVGDAVIESMNAQWESMMTKAKAHVSLRENIKKVFFSK